MQARPGSSNVWQGIVEAWDVIESNIHCRVGDGALVNFQVNRWIPKLQPLKDCSLFPLSDEDLEAMVAMFASNRVWKWNVLVNILPSSVCEKIASVAPPMDAVGPNLISRGLTNDNSFSLKSSYLALSNHLNAQPDLLFKLIWKWKGMERVRVFL